MCVRAMGTRLAHKASHQQEVNEMRSDDLQMLCQQLRRELDAAYAQRPWDAARIDRIAADLLHLERSLAVCHSRNVQDSAREPHPL
jgi:hypothetical protein